MTVCQCLKVFLPLARLPSAGLHCKTSLATCTSAKLERQCRRHILALRLPPRDTPFQSLTHRRPVRKAFSYNSLSANPTNRQQGGHLGLEVALGLLQGVLALQVGHHLVLRQRETLLHGLLPLPALPVRLALHKARCRRLLVPIPPAAQLRLSGPGGGENSANKLRLKAYKSVHLYPISFTLTLMHVGV